MKAIDSNLDKYRNRRKEMLFYGCNGDQSNGMFDIPLPNGEIAGVIVSDGGGWDHVSVSLKGRCPTWKEMCFIKDIFFEKDEVALQYHPAEKDYVNVHVHCLHLWRPQKEYIPCPPVEFV